MKLTRSCSSTSSSSSAVLFLLLFFFTCLFAASAFTFISDSRPSTGRNLLQAKQACNVSFEFLNYTIITSQCRAPQYPTNACCPAFKEFACPYAAELNDLANDCSDFMFSYINQHGAYPEGLFAKECKDGKDGLLCEATPPTESVNDNGDQTVNPSLLLVLTVGFLVAVLR